jgi:hypothetical protein
MFAAPLALAVLLHGVLLSGEAPQPGHLADKALPAAWLQVRSVPSIVTPPTVQDADATRVVAAPAIEARPSRRKASSRISAAASTLRPAVRADASSSASDEPDEPTQPVPVDSELVSAVADSAATGAGISVPVYTTSLPPPVALRYDLHKGHLRGNGVLTWKHAAQRYELKLQGSVAGIEVLTEISTGAIDANGLAPIRYTDARAHRATSAANFQRDKGKITYAGPQVEYPIVAGVQDRLSWMVQIASVLQANPQFAQPGGKVTFFVTGARGDADVWSFQYMATETLNGPEGRMRAVKFTREPRRPYDRMVEVWLMAERRYLPLRARFTTEAGEDAFELLLRDIQWL